MTEKVQQGLHGSLNQTTHTILPKEGVGGKDSFTILLFQKVLGLMDWTVYQVRVPKIYLMSHYKVKVPYIHFMSLQFASDSLRSVQLSENSMKLYLDYKITARHYWNGVDFHY